MSHPAQELLTAEALYRLPDDGQKYELVQGRLVSEPPPGGRHGLIAARMAWLLGNYAEAHGDGLVLSNDSGFILHRSPDTVRAPDVAWVRRDRFLELENDWALIPWAPELAVEVLSPSNRESQIHAKVADYLAAGTTLVWVIDGPACQVRSYRRLLEPEILSASDRLTAEDLLPGFQLTVGDIFAI